MKAARKETPASSQRPRFSGGATHVGGVRTKPKGRADCSQKDRGGFGDTTCATLAHERRER